MGHGRSSYPLSSSYPSHYSRRIMNTSYNSATPISSMQLMPSKSISRSSSKPNLSKTGIAHSPHSKPIPSNYSSCSARSSKSSSWVSKIGRLIGKKSLSSRHNSDLTEDNLEAHNRRIDILNQNYSNSSPYYTGVFTNPPLKLAHPGSSPRPKSHATTVSTSSSLSSFLDKVREFGSCFSPKKGNSSNNKPASYATISSSLSRIPKASLYKEMNIEEKKKISEKALLIEEGKPLRERVPEPTPTPTLALPSNEDQVINEKDMNEKVNEMSEFVWANKYRPKALEDFICNRDKAIELRSLVRYYCSHLNYD
jgi:replication factor C subunit 3/5